MVANAVVNAIQALNILQPQRLMPPVDAFSPPKKKRGRPPKPNNFSHRITTTLNISVNTSPLSSSPNAENNSNQIVKRGVPDVFTPTMRVSPSTRLRKRRKNSSISSLESISPNFGVTHRKTASLNLGSGSSSMSNSPTINSKALENISMITNNQQIYNTPPPSAVRRAAKKPQDLLPSVLIEAEKPVSPTDTTERQTQAVFESNDDFSLKLMIDDSGKAVLSNDFLNHESSQFVSNEPEMNHIADNHFGRRAQSFQDITKPPVAKPRLYHANSVIGMESTYHNNPTDRNASESFYVAAHDKQNLSQEQPLHHQQQQEEQAAHPHQQMANVRPVPVKFNSDNSWHPVSEVNPPQTPKVKENYLLAPTGLTPLSYNLTPQFNSMMYSMLESPAAKKLNNPQQFMFNQEFFVNSGGNGVNMNEYIGMNGNTSTNTNLTLHMSNMNSLQGASAQNYPNLVPTYNGNETFSPEDSDARLALKKKIHIRR